MHSLWPLQQPHIFLNPPLRWDEGGNVLHRSPCWRSSWWLCRCDQNDYFTQKIVTDDRTIQQQNGPKPVRFEKIRFFSLDFWIWWEDKVSCSCCDVLQDNAESKCPTQDFAKVKFLWFQYWWWSHISTKYISLKRAVQNPSKFSVSQRNQKTQHLSDNISGCPKKGSWTSYLNWLFWLNRIRGLTVHLGDTFPSSKLRASLPGSFVLSSCKMGPGKPVIRWVYKTPMSRVITPFSPW